MAMFIKMCLVADFFDDENMEPGPICTEPQPCDWHPRIDSVVYHGMDWNCPTYTERLGQEIKKHWGEITPELIISDIIAKVGLISYKSYDLTHIILHIKLLNFILRHALVMFIMQSMT